MEPLFFLYSLSFYLFFIYQMFYSGMKCFCRSLHYKNLMNLIMPSEWLTNNFMFLLVSPIEIK